MNFIKTADPLASLIETSPAIDVWKDNGAPSMASTSDISWSSGSSQSLRDLEGGGVPFQNGKCSLTDFAAKVQPAKDSHVMWGDVEVRIYPIIPGDHPDCVQGPPLTIAWDHVEEMTISINEFEKEREPYREEGEYLRLGCMARRTKLKRVGFGEKELQAAADASWKTRRQRQKTWKHLGKERFGIFQENMLRRLGRPFHPKKELITKY